MVRQLAAHPPAAPPGSRVSPAGGGAGAALSPAAHTLSQGHQELGRGGAHARSRSHHGTGWCLNYYCQQEGEHFHCVVLCNSVSLPPLPPLVGVLFKIALTSVLVFQAFRRTMALSRGDVDEAVLFAKVTENIR